MKKSSMMKKGLACAMAATMTVGLAACGGGDMLEKAEETIKRKNETAAVMRKMLISPIRKAFPVPLP